LSQFFSSVFFFFPATPFNDNNLTWQRIRHGRYVEFNLIFDRGTKFGLEMPNPNTEAILMSLPRYVQYEYRYKPQEGSAEAKLQEVVSKARDWMNTDGQATNKALQSESPDTKAPSMLK
jgi:coproporphyrinogen III oxidase